MANWANPTLTSLYTDFLAQLKDRDTDLALQFDGTTSTSLTTGTIRWSSSINRWQKWNGTAWAELTTTYALTGLSTTGNASIGGTLSVTGSTALGTATATTVATGDSSTNIATTAFVKNQAYATLASPALTGTPTAPTAAVGTNTTQIATTAYVNAEIANDAPTKTGTGASGTWGISITGNSATTSQRSFASDIASSGQGRFTGWYSDGAGNTGLGVEVGVSGGVGYVLTYNRSTATYGALNFQGGSTTAVLSGGTFNVSNGALQQAGNQVLHAANFNTYAPTLTGTGASGTWGINISGNAATATSATSATTATNLSGFTNSTLSNPVAGADTLTNNGLAYVTSVSLYGQNDGALYAQAYSSAWIHQIYGDYRTGQIAVRGKNNNTWQAWRNVLDSSNFNSYAPTLTGTGASGNWGINAVNLSTTRSNWSTNGTISAVVGQLAWKNFGNGHTIFDASNSTSPDGGAVNNTDPGIAWTATYPTLMGWNGSNTYGVRVDSARYASQVYTGTTAGRPASPTAGMIRYNTSLNQFEGYGTTWGSIGGGATGGGADQVFMENGQTVTTNYTLSTGKNAVSAGPITINAGITVTVPSGASWAIV